jgi:hypothetical protein
METHLDAGGAAAAEGLGTSAILDSSDPRPRHGDEELCPATQLMAVAVIDLQHAGGSCLGQQHISG